MPEEPTSPGQGELAGIFRATVPDGIDWARLARDDAAWAAFSHRLDPTLAPDFAYEDNYIPDHAGETYRGLEGLREAWIGFVEPYEEMVYALERIVGSGERFVSIHRVRTRARHSGIEQDFRIAYVWTFRSGRLVHCRGVADVDEALEVVRLED
jgi:ketosteroid isomerase-like protein